MLHLTSEVADQHSIDWSALLPPVDLTAWLVPDPVAKRLEMKPAAAIPDKDL